MNNIIFLEKKKEIPDEKIRTRRIAQDEEESAIINF